MPNSSQVPQENITSTHYDYIISGTGAAGLSLVMRMIASGKFSNKKILLVDKERKINNDRTWCFWERGQGFFEPIIYKSWPVLWFHAPGFSKQFDITPYKYKMIRGIDFYNHCFDCIRSQNNINILYGEISAMRSDNTGTSLTLSGKKFTADYIFNSILLKPVIVDKSEFYLLQHFKGWVIETGQPVFNPDQATLMDFTVMQDKGTAFVYIMPFSATKALVEFTMFSAQVLEQSDYNASLHDYLINKLHLNNYSIQSEEFGVIPMTNYRFPARDHNIINVGTAGGQTKASTGYTFTSIQKKTSRIVADLIRSGMVSNLKTPSRKFHFYDSVLLNVLATGKLRGEEVFSRIFQRNHTDLIFQFLDNESSFLQDLKLISSLPTIPFLKAGLQELF